MRAQFKRWPSSSADLLRTQTYHDGASDFRRLLLCPVVACLREGESVLEESSFTQRRHLRTFQGTPRWPACPRMLRRAGRRSLTLSSSKAGKSPATRFFRKLSRLQHPP